MNLPMIPPIKTNKSKVKNPFPVDSILPALTGKIFLKNFRENINDIMKGIESTNAIAAKYLGAVGRIKKTPRPAPKAKTPEK